MAKKPKEKASSSKDYKDLSALDKLARTIITSVDPSYKERNILSSKDEKFQRIANREFDLAKGVSNGSIIDFLMTLKQNDDANNVEKFNKNASNMFTDDIGSVYSYFQDIYKNKYLEMSDLKFVSKFIPALGEAVDMTLNSIVSTDNFSTTVSRTIVLPPSLDETQRDTAMSVIESEEKSLKLQKRLKNTVYKNTLVAGRYYVYAKGYGEIFEEYDRMIQEGKFTDSFGNPKNKVSKKQSSNPNPATESVDYSSISEGVESYVNTVLTTEEKSSFKKDFDKLKSSMAKFTIDDSFILIDAMEGAVALKKTQAIHGDILGNYDFNQLFAESAHDPAEAAKKKKTKNTKYPTTGTYIKYIEAKYMMPIKLFNDQIIGYYYIHADSRASVVGKPGTTNSMSMLFSSTKIDNTKKEQIIDKIVADITEKITEKFSTKFIADNEEHKKLIADCIIANGMVDTDYKIQFIPACDVVPFVINEDENGEGESILAKSLFPAKLLLYLLVTGLLAYMNKSGNITYAHIHKGPIDVNGSNHTQRILRALQDNVITPNDLMSTNMVFSKLSRDRNISLPTSRNGQKIVEFETQEGQQVDFNTPIIEKLENMTILGTGVPSVMMEYINQADFAKAIETANLKYAKHICGLQTDLDEPTTQLYKILIHNSTLDDELKNVLERGLEVKLTKPSVLESSNSAEFLRTRIDLAKDAVNVYLGENNEDPDKNRISDLMVKDIVMNNISFLNMTQYDEYFDKAKEQVAKERKENGTTPDTSSSDATTDVNDDSPNENFDF